MYIYGNLLVTGSTEHATELHNGNAESTNFGILPTQRTKSQFLFPNLPTLWELIEIADITICSLYHKANLVADVKHHITLKRHQHMGIQTYFSF